MKYANARNDNTATILQVTRSAQGFHQRCISVTSNILFVDRDRKINIALLIFLVGSGDAITDTTACYGLSKLSFKLTAAISLDKINKTIEASRHAMLLSLLDMDRVMRERVGTRYWLNRIYIDATPSTGLIGSATDAAKLMSALLDTDLLSSSSIELMHPHGDERPLGWAEFGDNWVQHRGGGPGFATITIMRLYPEKNLGITILANSTNLKSEALVEMIAGMDW